jgi:glycosyltransferase involved in cell wall biosynthesis
MSVSMKLSIIIPAYNEEKLIGACLVSVRQAAKARGLTDYELIVCDNASTDATAAIAQKAGAKLAREPIRRISRSRNAGAAAAAGDWLLFIDADSILTPTKLEELLAAIKTGRLAGGGSLIDFDAKPWWGALAVRLWTAVSLTMRWAAGSFLFCRADAFREVGGFPPDLAAGEEVGLSQALKAWGKPRGLGFTIITESRHISSGRKFRLYSFREFLVLLWEIAKSPRRNLRDTAVLKPFYDGRR